MGTLVGGVLAIISSGVGVLLWELAARVFPENSVFWESASDAIFSIAVLFSQLLMGAWLGLGQWQTALRGKVDKRSWIVSSAVIGITGAIGFIASGRLSPGMVTSYGGVASSMDTGYRILDTWPIGAAIHGAFLGVGIGVPQWFALRRSVRHAGWWIPANVIGGIAMFASFIAVVRINDSAVLSGLVSLCTGPTIFAVITGVVLFRLLHHPISSTAS